MGKHLFYLIDSFVPIFVYLSTFPSSQGAQGPESFPLFLYHLSLIPTPIPVFPVLIFSVMEMKSDSHHGLRAVKKTKGHLT